jgi:hypothetical protein
MPRSSRAQHATSARRNVFSQLFSPTGRKRSRLMTAVAAVTTGLLAATIVVVGIAGPASAHAANFTASSTCNSADGTAVVTWKVSNDFNKTLTVTASDNAAIPIGTTVAATGNGPDTFVTRTQNVAAPAANVKVSTTLSFQWADGYEQKNTPASITIPKTCVIPDKLDAAAALTVTPESCLSGQTVVLGAVTNATWGTITYPTKTSYSVTATAVAGHKFSDGKATKVFTGALKAQVTGDACLTSVTVKPLVSVTAPTCSAAGSLVIPAQTGVIFTGGTNGAGPGTYTVVASAASGYKLTAPYSVTVTVPGKVTGDACLIPVTVTAVVSATTPTCTVAGSLVVPTQANVYFTGGANGDGPGTYTVVAHAADGYKLTAPYSVTVTVPGKVTGDACLIPVTVTAVVSATTPTCTVAGVLVVPTQANVYFTGGANGDGPGTYTVVAHAAPGYKLTAPYSVTVTVPAKVTGDVCLTPVTVTAVVSATTPTCFVEGSLVVPTQANVYFTGGANGDGPGVYTVVAHAADGYKLTAPYSVTVTVPGKVTGSVCDILVAPVEPTIVKTTECGSTGSVSPVAVTGVAYALSFDGKTGNYSVVATPEPGYKFDGAQIVVYEGNIGAYSGCVTVPTDPKVTHEVCNNGETQDGSITVAAVDHVSYSLAGKPTAGDSISLPSVSGKVPLGAGTYTVTAKGDFGYTLQGTNVWTLTILPVEVCDIPTLPLVTPVLSSTQPSCDADGSYTLTDLVVEGEHPLVWSVDGKVTAPGTYSAKAGTTVKVSVATSGPDFGFDSETQTDWTLDFAAAKSCDQLTTLAFTGANGDMGGLMIAGLLLLLAGAGVYTGSRLKARRN